MGVVAALLGWAGCDRDVALPGSTTCLVRGIDVSRHQGEIDWRHVADAGIRFAWIKATEGGDYLDPAFRRNWMLARAVGLQRGAYLFVYWCRRAEDQAAWFVANVPDDPDALPPVLDVEWNPQSRSCLGKVAKDAALADMKIILEALEKTYRKRPVIYAPLDFFNEVMRGALTDYPLWVRSLGDLPKEGYGDRPWQFWQHSDVGSVAGIVGAVDRDCFDGTPGTWRTWLARAVVIP